MTTRILGLVALVAVAAATVVGLFVVPADLNQGDAQRIMYPHVASAWLAYLSFGVTALAGIGWLWRRDLRLDAIALAGALIAAAEHHNAAKTRCRRGHPFDAANTYYDAAGKRRCRACLRAAWHRWKAERRQPAPRAPEEGGLDA